MTTDTGPFDDNGGGKPWQWFVFFAAVFVAIMGLGAVFGFLSANFVPDAEPFRWRDAAILAVIVAVALGAALVGWRMGRRLLGRDAKVPSRERRSRNILIASGVMGVIIGIILAGTGLATSTDDPFALLSDDPINPWGAAGLSLVLATVLPWMCWRWDRAIDEHERDAYRAGAVAAAYFFLIVGPVWWLLWRGNLIPEPNAVIFYFVFNFLFLTVWFWKKYR